MGLHSHTFLSLLIRLLLASPLLLSSFWIPIPLFCVFAYILAAFLIAPPIAELLGEGSGTLFYPGERSSHIPPMYGIPAAKAKKGEYEAALHDYEDICVKYPDEVEPYLRMVEICIVNLGAKCRAEDIYARGMRLLKKEASRDTLREMYAATVTRLKDATREPRRISYPKNARLPAPNPPEEGSRR